MKKPTTIISMLAVVFFIGCASTSPETQTAIDDDQVGPGSTSKVTYCRDKAAEQAEVRSTFRVPLNPLNPLMQLIDEQIAYGSCMKDWE